MAEHEDRQLIVLACDLGSEYRFKTLRGRQIGLDAVEPVYKPQAGMGTSQR